MHYSRIIISDLHLGIKDAKAKEIIKFLKENTCDELIMNGDIIDFWALKRGSKWKKSHSNFFKTIIELSNTTRIIYIRGNHDDILESLIPIFFNNFELKMDYSFTALNKKKYYVIHGDIFDHITTNFKWLSVFGSMMYDLLLFINRVYNKRREKQGKPYYSLSRDIKKKVKLATNYISDYEEKLVTLCKTQNYQGIICGHIHHPENKYIGGIHYLNSGDLVENVTVLVEDISGEFKIINL